MNIQRPLPNPFGPDKKVPFPSRMPSTGVTPPPAMPKPALPPLPTQLTAPLPSAPTFPSKTSPEQTEVEEELTDVEEAEEEYEEVELISDEEDEFLSRIFAATASPVAQQTLFALARDDNWQIRNAVAMSVDAPVNVLNLLANDPEDFVRQSVLENLNTSDETYANFAYDEDEDIQIAFIQNERTTLDLLRPLLDTDNEFVAEELIDTDLLPTSMKIKIRTKFPE